MIPVIPSKVLDNPVVKRIPSQSIAFFVRSSFLNQIGLEELLNSDILRNFPDL